jgi:signal transduction histidine kinase
MRALRAFRRLDERGLRILFGAVFLALAVPAALLVAQAFGQLKWEAFRSTQVGAEELAVRIDAALAAAVATEDARSFADYGFLVAEGDAAGDAVRRSPLAAFPVAASVPGIVGYFQVDDAGRLTTPLLPGDGADAARYGVAQAELAARAALAARIRTILIDNRLVRAGREPQAAERPGVAELGRFDDERRSGDAASREEVARAAERDAAAAAAPASEASQAAFDRLIGQDSIADEAATAGGARAVTANDVQILVDLPSARAPTAPPARRTRVEPFPLQESLSRFVEPQSAPAEAAKRDDSVRTFASEIDPLEVGALATGHFVLFRNVWRDGRRFIQGALVEQAAFTAAAIEAPYRASSVAAVSHLDVSFDGRPLATLVARGETRYSPVARELSGTLLHRARLSPPFGGLELAFSVGALPSAPGAGVLYWVAITLAVVLCGGFLLMYRFAVGQLELARRQQDFVSAVSHELKTPLTSIRMYGEMLKAGWADEDKKRVYYDYIHSESERLSRLIDNVLELARLSRSQRHFAPKPAAVAELLDMVRSKVATQMERAGFELRVDDGAGEGAEVRVDVDAFAQIFINLVDNALKFAANAHEKAIEIASRSGSDGILFTVRDFGPGVPKAQMRRIFELFYRGEGGLTRESAGTGIGLALVRQLVTAMGGRVEVRNVEPGAEFRVLLPR